jgi:hypothetical protein
MGKKMNASKVLKGKPEGNRPPGRSDGSSIKMDLKQ